MLTNSVKLLLIAVAITLVCSPSKPAVADEANYGPFQCVRHGRGDDKTCVTAFQIPAGNGPIVANISADGQGYGGTSEISVSTCFSNDVNGYSGFCSNLFTDSNYPDNCPDPDDSCGLWFSLFDNSRMETTTQYNYVIVKIYVKDAGARVFANISNANAPAPTGQIIVESNIPTNWVISGAENFTGSGIYGSYTAPASSTDYFISVPGLAGYYSPKVTPGLNQTLYPDQTIKFTIFYQINPGGSAPDPAPSPQPSPAPNPTPAPNPNPNPMPGTAIVSVLSNIPTSWVVTGPDNFQGSGTNASYVANAGTYKVINVPSAIDYNNTSYELESVKPAEQLVLRGNSIYFTIKYAEKVGLKKPTIVGAGNGICSQISLKWLDNSNNEQSFIIYRSETEQGGDYRKYLKVATVGANVTSYHDRPALNKSYYYIVAAHNSSLNLHAPSSAFYSSFNIACESLIDGEISISAVNGSTTFDLNDLKDDDVLTIQIIIDNLGPSDGYITKITNQLSPTLINPKNLSVSGPNALINSPGITGTHPNITLNVNGKKDVGGTKWIVKFDVNVKLTGTTTSDQIGDCAVIHYFDQAGNKTRRLCLDRMLIKNTTVKRGVEFREIAP